MGFRVPAEGLGFRVPAARLTAIDLLVSRLFQVARQSTITEPLTLLLLAFSRQLRSKPETLLLLKLFARFLKLRPVLINEDNYELWKPAIPSLFGRGVALLRNGDPVLLGKGWYTTQDQALRSVPATVMAS